MKSCAIIAVWFFVVGFLGGAGVMTFWHQKKEVPVRYIYVHDIAANRGGATCPKINSGQILKASEREMMGLSVVLHCKYNPRSKVNDPVM